MIMVGICGWRSSRARIRARNSTLSLDTGLVSYTVGSVCMRTSRRIMGLLSHVLSCVVLSMAMNTALAAA